MLSGTSPLGPVHGWRAPGINACRSVSACVRRGLHVWACVSTSAQCSRYKTKQVYPICLLFQLLSFLLLLSPLNTCKASTSELRTPSDNSTAEARFNCPGGGKLNKAVKEKFLPLPFHLNLWLLAAVLLSAATHWEAWNERGALVFIETHALLSGRDTVKSHFHSRQPELILNNVAGVLLQQTRENNPKTV